MQRLAGKLILLWGWRRLLVAFFAGAILVLAQAPYDFPAAGFISFPVLVWLLDGASPELNSGLLRRVRPAFATGFFFGLGYFLAGLWWIGSAFLVDAEGYAWALPIGVIGLPMVMALFYGFAAASARLLWSEGMGRLATLAACFALAEWLRGFVLTGFPWNSVGYAVMPIPLLMQPAHLVGMIGMNAFAVFVFSTPALLADRVHFRTGALAALTLVALQAGYGHYVLSQPTPAEWPRLQVRIIQTAVDQAVKWDDAERTRVFRRLLDETGSAPAEGAPPPTLILWPETTMPYLLTRDAGAVTALGETLKDGQVLVAGAVRVEEAQGTADRLYYNSATVVDDKGVIIDAADKVHLVPGGEYLPFEPFFRWLGVSQLVAGPNNFAAGSMRRAVTVAGTRLLPLICYEVIFSAEVDRDAEGADVLLNLSNDGWFGDTPGPYQHLRQAQLRAVETGKPMLRSVNLGVSAAIDERGRIIDAFSLAAHGPLDVGVSVPPAVGRRFDLQLAGGLVAAGFGLLGLFLYVRQRLRVN